MIVHQCSTLAHGNDLDEASTKRDIRLFVRSPTEYAMFTISVCDATPAPEPNQSRGRNSNPRLQLVWSILLALDPKLSSVPLARQR